MTAPAMQLPISVLAPPQDDRMWLTRAACDQVLNFFVDAIPWESLSDRGRKRVWRYYFASLLVDGAAIRRERYRIEQGGAIAIPERWQGQHDLRYAEVGRDYWLMTATRSRRTDARAYSVRMARGFNQRVIALLRDSAGQEGE